MPNQVPWYAFSEAIPVAYTAPVFRQTVQFELTTEHIEKAADRVSLGEQPLAHVERYSARRACHLVQLAVVESFEQVDGL